MDARGLVVWDDSLLAYDFGPLHPMAPVRMDLTMRLARDLGVLETMDLQPVPGSGDDDLLLVHEPAYVEAVRQAGRTGAADVAHGLGTPDVPVFADMHTVSSRVVAATVAAARAVWSGEAVRAVSPSGGLHHAMRGLASGFCVYNDVAAAIAWLLEHGARRVAYVDVDAHHGDGVERIFWDDERVLTVSVHESPRTLFPGTGWPDDIGGPSAQGTAVNVALPAGTGDAGWLRAIHSVVPQLLADFRPDVVVSQHGADSHFLDPLTHLAVSVDGQRAAMLAVAEWADTYAGGRWVASGGGGYAVVDVVPRAWSHLLAVVAGHPLPPETAVPEGWREYAHRLTGQPAPFHLTDGPLGDVVPWSRGYDPADPLDRAVLATRRAVFGFHGLDPERD